MLKRLLIILQLCLSFSILLYFLGFPFFGSHFFYQSELLLVESAMGKQDLLVKLDPDKAKERRELSLYKMHGFTLLPSEDQALLLSRKKSINAHFASPFWIKMVEGIKQIARVPLPLLIWTPLAIVLSILLLLKNRRASQLLPLLPLLALLFAVQNFLFGTVPQDSLLFPTEEQLAQIAPGEPLKTAWEKYLVANWRTPSENPDEELALAEQRFQVRWIEKRSIDPASSWNERMNPWMLLLFIAWNLGFVFAVRNRKESR
jgi:hypothetical protein